MNMDAGSSAEVDQLLETLRALDRISDVEWQSALNERKREELTFHDVSHSDEESASRESGRANKKFYTTTKMSSDYLSAWIRENAAGKIFLDYACGTGTQCVEAAEAGSPLAVGLDISPVSIENARKRAADAGVSERTFFLVGDCENTGFPDACFDRVLCAGMLHHLDLSYAFPELRRIMKPGAKLLGVEALNYNPVIRMYRNLTPELRTTWEKDHILSLKDLKFARRFFEIRDVRYWNLATVGVTPLRKSSLFEPALRLANKIDSYLLRLPPVNRLAWSFTFELVKPLGA
jgi:SAM-dependent methyltransferase